jgi:Cu(I)/Ag(I) efflux system membrane protein CusA/SilA
MLQYLKLTCNDAQLNTEDPKHYREQLHIAIRDGALSRIRPVMMTALVDIVGLAPILLGSGTGSDMMSRIAAPMVGGMFSAVLLTLFVLPASFLLWKSSAMAKK